MPLINNPKIPILQTRLSRSLLIFIKVSITKEMAFKLKRFPSPSPDMFSFPAAEDRFHIHVSVSKNLSNTNVQLPSFHTHRDEQVTVFY